MAFCRRLKPPALTPPQSQSTSQSLSQSLSQSPVNGTIRAVTAATDNTRLNTATDCARLMFPSLHCPSRYLSISLSLSLALTHLLLFCLCLFHFRFAWTGHNFGTTSAENSAALCCGRRVNYNWTALPAVGSKCFHFSSLIFFLSLCSQWSFRQLDEPCKRVWKESEC